MIGSSSQLNTANSFSRSTTAANLQKIVQGGGTPSQKLQQVRDLTLTLSRAMHAAPDTQLLLNAMLGPPHTFPLPTQPHQQQPTKPVSAAERWGRARSRSQPPPSPGGSGASTTSPTPSTLTWLPSRVTHLSVLGLGSVSSLCTTTPSSATTTPLGRQTFRIHQLALSLSLAQLLASHRPDNQPAPPPKLQLEYFDPDFNELDAELLTSLGGLVSGQWGGLGVSTTSPPAPSASAPLATALSPSHRPHPSPSSQALLYMPCCTRQLYGQVVQAHQNTSCLHNIAILGNSFKSLQDSNSLLRALTGLPRPSSPSSPATAPRLQTPEPCPAPSPDGEDEGHGHDEAMSAAALAELLAGMAARGAVVERSVPDFEAHGVAVALHLFPQPGP